MGAPFFAGLIIGQCGRKSKIDDFKATLPVSNSTLSAMILRPGVAGILSAFMIYAAGLFFMIGWFSMVGEGEAVSREWHDVIDAIHKFGYGNTLLLVAMGIIVALGLMGLGTSLAFTGRPLLLWGLWFVICPVVITLSILNWFDLIPSSVVPALLSSAPWAIGTASLLGTVWAFVAAHRRHLIAARTLCLAFGFWLILCVFAGLIWLPKMETEPPFILLAIGLLSLPVALSRGRAAMEPATPPVRSTRASPCE